MAIGKRLGTSLEHLPICVVSAWVLVMAQTDVLAKLCFPMTTMSFSGRSMFCTPEHMVPKNLKFSLVNSVPGRYL